VNVLNLFKPAPFIEPIEDPEVLQKQYKYWRVRIFYSMFFGYAFFYFTRKSFTFAMPAMIIEMGFTKSELGILSSILFISYGASKFVSGILGDRSNPRYFMAFGLIATGVINILFGFSSSLIIFAVLWGLNGWFQGFGWPPACRLLTHWYSQSERGRWWSAWSTSHNVGGAVIPILVGYCAQSWGWRYAMYVPGVICVIMGLWLVNRLRDTPQSLGLPAVEKFRNDNVTGDNPDKERELSVKETLFKYVLSNKLIWMLAIAYFFVYVVRTAVNDWTALFLFEERGYSQMGAGGIVAWFEFGGFFGMLIAGWASDTIFKGKRVPVMVIYMVGIMFPIMGFWMVSSSTTMFDTMCMVLVGFFIFGPQMLVGCCAADLSHKKAAATATGFVGWFAYIGAAFAGYPLGKIIEVYGWIGFFVTIAVCSIITILLLIPMWSVRSRSEAQRAALDSDKKEEALA